jgi:ketosteroid isomerase-like protein
MSQQQHPAAGEQVELAKRAIDAFNDVDVDRFAALATEGFEWSPSMVAIEGETFRGDEGIRAYFASLGESWEQFRILPGTFRELPDVVVMLGSLRGRGKNSGVTVDASLGMVFDLRDGRISRIRGFLDHAHALKAVGLPADPAP